VQVLALACAQMLPEYEQFYCCLQAARWLQQQSYCRLLLQVQYVSVMQLRHWRQHPLLIAAFWCLLGEHLHLLLLLPWWLALPLWLTLLLVLVSAYVSCCHHQQQLLCPLLQPLVFPALACPVCCQSWLPRLLCQQQLQQQQQTVASSTRNCCGLDLASSQCQPQPQLQQLLQQQRLPALAP
jgi:hypothetical protein